MLANAVVVTVLVKSCMTRDNSILSIATISSFIKRGQDIFFSECVLKRLGAPPPYPIILFILSIILDNKLIT